MKTTSRCLLLALAILASGFSTMAQVQRKPDATKILNNMARVYSQLTSYQDEGILVTTHDEPTGGTIEKMPFKTHFKRPNLFRFEWTEFRVSKLGRVSMIWFDGKDAFLYWEPSRYEKEESFRLAVAGASGITDNAVTHVLHLLLPAEFSTSILDRLKKVSLAGEEVFEGTRCYRIKAVDGDENYELWVGKTDSLLRKVRREKKKGDDLWIKEEVRRKIQVNQSIGEVVFNYKPSIPLKPAEESNTKDLEALINPGPPVWTEFKSDEGRFTVSMPQKPATQSSVMDTPQGRFEQHIFIASHRGVICMVAYTDLPKNSLAGNDPDGFFDGVRDQFIKQVEGKLGTESPLTLDGHTGRDIKVLMFRGEHRLRLFLVGERMYMLSIMQLEKDSEPGEDIPGKFFGSFKLSPIAKPVAALR